MKESTIKMFVRLAGFMSLAVLVMAAFQLSDGRLTIPNYELFGSCFGIVIWLTGEWEWRRESSEPE